MLSASRSAARTEALAANMLQCVNIMSTQGNIPHVIVQQGFTMIFCYNTLKSRS